MVASISPVHEQIEAVGRAVRHAAELDLVARNEAFQHLQGQIVGAEEERHADQAVGELLRGLHRRFRPHHQCRIGHDRAAADLAAADLGALDPRIVAPLAGIIEVRLAFLEQLAVAGKTRRFVVIGIGDVELRGLVDALLAIGPFDGEAFLLEQALVVGDQLRQSLERRGGFEPQCLLHELISQYEAAAAPRLPRGGDCGDGHDATSRT